MNCFMTRNLTLRQLRAFAAVADQGSFTAAATRMHLTQSALSVLVRELERELGARLFDRHTRRVLLTEAGQELLPYATRVLADLEQAAGAVAGLRDKSRGRLRLAVPQLMASTLGARAIAAFHRQHPGIAIELHDTPTDQLVAQVLAGEVELAIGVEVPASADIQRTRAAARPPLAGVSGRAPAGRTFPGALEATWRTCPSSRRRATSCAGSSRCSRRAACCRCRRTPWPMSAPRWAWSPPAWA